MKTRLYLLSAIMLLTVPSFVSGQRFSGKPAGHRTIGVREKLPMLQTKWAEGCYYNAACPNDTAAHTTCLRIPAGPGAVAMAQMMKYYQYPAHGTGEHGYLHPKYGIQYANFGATNYNWGVMSDSLTSGNEALATLIYQCGVAQNMNYGAILPPSSLPEDIDTAFVKYFGYPDGAIWQRKGLFSHEEWSAMMKAELDASHPVLCVAYNNTASREQYFICDGYNDNGLFHINWGSGGALDGYYPLDSLFYDSVNFAIIQKALFGLVPPPPGPGSYVMDFEDVPDFALTFNSWTVKDVDMHDTYGITGFSFPHQTTPMAFLSFNPAGVTPSMAADLAIQPHGGQRFGACFSSNPPSNNDWFISPQIQLGIDGSFSFWVKSYTSENGLDNYRVAVSATDNNPASFTVISGTQPLQTTTFWAKKTFNLSAFNNQKVYVAINCVSNDNYLMMIDDLEVKTQAGSGLAADFTADKLSVKVGETVSFTDQSSGMPTSWSWKFTGAMPATSSLQNPSGISYAAPGSYEVSLKVSNGINSDSITKSGFIKVAYPGYMSLDFESVSDFSLSFDPWTVKDVKGGNTYGINQQSGIPYSFPHANEPMAFICFNPSKTTPPITNLQPHAGQKLGCCFSSTPPMNPNNKWLISPRMGLGNTPKIDFWVQAYNSQYGDEKYNVAVSVTNLNPSSFVPVNATPEIAPDVWTHRSYDLSAYSNQDVYIGIQCVTNNSFIFMIDDISITSSLGVNEPAMLDQIVVFPNPANDYLFVNRPFAGQGSIVLNLFSMPGEKIASWQEIPVSGKIMLDIRSLPQGFYLLEIVSGTDKVIRKVSIVHQ